MIESARSVPFNNDRSTPPLVDMYIMSKCLLSGELGTHAARAPRLTSEGFNITGDISVAYPCTALEANASLALDMEGVSCPPIELEVGLLQPPTRV